MYEQYTYCTTKCFQKQRYLHVHLQTVKCISKVQIWVLHYIITEQIKQQLCSDLQPDYTSTRNLSIKIALKWKTCEIFVVVGCKYAIS